MRFAAAGQAHTSRTGQRFQTRAHRGKAVWIRGFGGVSSAHPHGQAPFPRRTPATRQ